MNAFEFGKTVPSETTGRCRYCQKVFAEEELLYVDVLAEPAWACALCYDQAVAHLAYGIEVYQATVPNTGLLRAPCISWESSRGHIGF
jgi:hypothetical protein